MKVSRLAPRLVPAATVAVAVAATVAAGPALARPASPRGGEPGPVIRLITAQRTITAQRFGNRTYLDPGIYVTTSRSPLEFLVTRASYAKPIAVTQVIKVPGEPEVLRPLPRWTLRGWAGLRGFLRYSVKNAAGKTVTAGVLTFCPASYNPQRAMPNSPQSSPFPQGCAGNPFELGAVWGLQRGWGADPFTYNGLSAPLRLGTYTMTVNVTRPWRRLLHVTARAAVTTVKVRVVKASQCQPFTPCAATRRRHAAGPLPRLPRVPAMTRPPASVLPDLVPLPSIGISVMNRKATKTRPAASQLDFGATVWIGGHARLDVEAFRSHGSPVMKAYQYFFRNGHVVGRAPAGTMGFDTKKGHDHWHFQQFAEYRLLNASRSVVLRSQKVGFCIAPTDAIDLALPHAMWQPSYLGFGGGACGSPTALWVQEMLPLGWGDTYYQFVAGQSFDISKLPNGTYYIQIIANPEKLLHETNYANDVSLRKVILGGTPGHRTVTVPAYHGIDPEH